jgi:opacity protein-like surface antigen
MFIIRENHPPVKTGAVHPPFPREPKWGLTAKAVRMYNYSCFAHPRIVRLSVHVVWIHYLKEGIIMKKSVFAMLAILFILSSGTAAFAKASKTGRSADSPAAGDVELDGSFAFATGPDSFDSGFGLNFGAGYTLSAVDKNLQARLDLSFFQFKNDYFFGGGSTGLTYTRVPFTVSGRYYFPILDRLRAFAQAGLETSFDSFDFYANGGKHSKSEVNLGLAPGGGIEFFVNRNLSLFALGRAHLISDSYFSMHFGAAGHF